MPDVIHHSRLTWRESRGSGVAEHDGVTVLLRKRPPVLTHIAKLAELVFVPSECVRYVQDSTDARRDLMEGEGNECMHYLQQLAMAARHASDRKVSP